MAADNVKRDPRGVLDTPLRRAISRPLLILFVLGDILGAGIYAVIGEVAGAVGGAIWASFLLAFVLALLTAFAYAELVTKYPHAAGAALYVHKALSVPFLTFLVAVAVMASGITSAATSARAFGGDYLATFVELPTALVGLVFVVVLALVNYRGIRESVRLNALLSVIEASGLLFVVGIGVMALAGGTGDPSQALTFRSDTPVTLALLSGAVLSFFSFVGFEDSVNVAEETTDPGRSYPIALFGGLGLALVIYLLVTFTAAMVVAPDVLAESSGPLLEVVRVGAPGVPLGAFSVIALLAVTNTALINLIMASRLLYGLARQGIIPATFARVDHSRQTPWVAIIAVTLVAGLLVVTGDLGGLASTTVILLLLVFSMVNVAVLVLRRDSVDHQHFRAPSALPMLGAVSSLGLVVYRVADQPGDVLRAVLLLGGGILLWFVNHRMHRGTRELDVRELGA